MTSLFLSHSSADRRVAQEVGTRIRAMGFASLFVDVDPGQGILPGQPWERELYSALRRSDAVVFLVSDASLASRWCFAELALARSLGKPVFPVRVGGTAGHDLVADIQEVDLADEDAYVRLGKGLRRAGLDPDDAFGWDSLRSPYPGLRAFRPEDAAVFFGRNAEISHLLGLLQPTLARGAGRWVGIVGPSGSGKSSLLHAGLLPRLARRPEQWLVVPPVTPGANPTRRLAMSLAVALTRGGRPLPAEEVEHRLTNASSATAALRSIVHQLSEAAEGPRNVLVVVDQAEELLTRAGSREQQSFLRMLGGAKGDDSPLWVVSTMRSEFLSRAPERAGLTEYIDDTLLIEPLSRSRLPEVIARPAARAGLDFEPGLVERIVDETDGGDAVSLLAYTLRELAGSSDAVLTAEAYEELGGVVGALRRRADGLRDDLQRRGQGSLVVPTLLRLASVDADGLPVRRRVPLAALSGDERAVVDAFVDARLLTTGAEEPGSATRWEATVEMAHEALLRQWEPLREAIESSRYVLRLRADLGREAADWRAGGRDASYLLRGCRLAAIDLWATANPGDVEAPEREFLQAGRAAVAEQAHAAVRTNRRLRWLSAGLATFLVAALGAGGIALQQGAEATAQAELALSRQLLAQSAEVRRSQPDVSLLLDVEAARRTTGSGAEDTRFALVDSLNRSFHVSTTLTGHTGEVNAVAFSPDGRTLATSGDDGTVRRWAVADGAALGELPPAGTGPARKVRFSPDGSVLAVVEGPAIRLWATDSWSPRGEPLTGHGDDVVEAVFSPDGTTLASVSNDRTVRLWDVATGQLRMPALVGHEDVVFAAAFSPDGRTLASASWDGTVRLWDVASGRPGKVLTGHTAAVTAVLVGPDGSTVVSSGDDGTVRTWDLRSGRPLHVFGGHQGAVTALAISPDGSVVASGDERAVRLWDVTGTRPPVVLTGHTDVVIDLVFAPDGSTVTSAANDGTLRMWDVASGTAVDDALAGHTSWINDIALAPDGRTLASASGDGTARTWQTAVTTPLVRELVDGPASTTAVAFGPAGSLATAGPDNTVRLWDARTGAATSVLTGHTAAVTAVAFGPGTLLASGSADGTVRLWDTAGGQPVGPAQSAAGTVRDLVFSRDGTVLASAGSNGSIQLWGATDGRPVATLTGHEGNVNALAFGPNGVLASGGDDRTIRLWDTTARRPAGPPVVGTDPVLGVAFDPQGTTLASTGADAAVRFWDAATAAPRGNPITGFTSWVNGVAFSPDGATLATAADGGLQMWDAATGRPRGAPLIEDRPVFRAAFSPDGLMVADADKTTTAIWNMHKDSLIANACDMANRNLTEAEWQKFFGPETRYAPTCP